MKAKHTPGPWTVYDDSDNGKTGRIEIAALGKTVARIYNSVPSQDLPNARLIAAAPELLEALQWLYAICLRDGLIPDSMGYMKQAEEAIAKARGVASTRSTRS